MWLAGYDRAVDTLPQGMEEMLQSALRSSPAELQDQIKYIIVQFQSGEPKINAMYNFSNMLCV